MNNIKKALDQVVGQAKRNLPVTSQRKWEVDIPTRYGDKIEFLKTFNPDKQTEYAKMELRCFTGTAPELVRVAVVYGDAVAESWLEIQIQDLALFSGVKDKLAIAQIQNTARTILLNYGFLKVTELMVFFQKFKAGFYGKFYGVVDGLVITSALHEFMQYRSKKLDEAIRMKENERFDQLQEEAKNAITREEYLRRKAEKELNSESDTKG